MSTFGVGLVAYNMKFSDIEDLSKSLGYTKPEYQVVVDNSQIPTKKEVFEKFGWTYIHNPSNPGFGTAHNLIFEKFSDLAEYHLIINPDIVFTGNIVFELINFLSKNEHAGCVMPKIYYPNGNIQRLAKLLPGPKDLILRRLAIPKVKSRINKRFELHEANYESGNFMVPFVSGCFLLFRTSVIKNLGFFDERYFMYMEDTDLSRKLWVNKHPPYYYGGVSVIHNYTRESSKKLKLFRIHIVSAIKYFNKWGWFDKNRRVINKDCRKQFS